jgi:hypothetical protein
MARSQDDVRQEMFRQPFKPAADAQGNPIDIQMAIRSAWAMEYIAAQLGMIRQRLEQDRNGDTED